MREKPVLPFSVPIEAASIAQHLGADAPTFFFRFNLSVRRREGLKGGRGEELGVFKM
jgi:hypothetical protein